MTTPDLHARARRAVASVTAEVLMAVVLLAAVLAVAPITAAAQGEAPPPSASPAGSGASLDLAALIPQELAGIPVPRDEVVVRRGADLTQGSPDIEAQYQAVVDATGVPLEAMGQATAFVQSDDGELLNLSVLHVPGADAAVVRDVVLPIVLAGWDGASSEETELAGLAVTVIRSDDPEVDAVYIYPDGDLLWLVSGLEEVVTETLADIAG